jgi:hypothetical protein
MTKAFYLGLEIDTPASKIAIANIDCGIAKSYIGLGRISDAKYHAAAAVEVHEEYLEEKDPYPLFCREILATA